MQTLSGQKQNNIRFRRKIRNFYRVHKRDFPWRDTKNPYHILVSEIMLQQTQTHRVVSKYQSFIKKFPSIKKLATASLGDVLEEWQGLGYNRRAKMLHGTAKRIIEMGGRFPQEYKELILLPGVGEYTGKAIRTFAWDKREVFIETNIRAVFIHEFFNNTKVVSDAELLLLIEQTLPKKDFRNWYAGLMDYGAHLKKVATNPSRKSASYAKQKPFKGSDREIRGAIIRTLAKKSERLRVINKLPFDGTRIKTQLQKLLKEGLIEYSKGKYHLPL